MQKSKKKERPRWYKPDWVKTEIPFMEAFKNSKPIPMFTDEDVDLLVATADGTIINLDTKHTLKPYAKDATGHMLVKLRIGDEYKHRAVHHLVAWAWLPNPQEKEYVHHINGIPSDNRQRNLVWVTTQEHKYLHKLMRENHMKEYFEEVQRLRGVNY